MKYIPADFFFPLVFLVVGEEREHDERIDFFTSLGISQRLGIGTPGTYQQGNGCRQLHAVVHHLIDERHH